MGSTAFSFFHHSFLNFFPHRVSKWQSAPHVFLSCSIEAPKKGLRVSEVFLVSGG